MSAVLRVMRVSLRSAIGRQTVVRVGDRSRILVSLWETNSRKAAVHRLPDLPEMLVWREHLRDGDLFVDVGANIGMYSVLAGESGAQVIACEPVPTAVHRLRENIAVNGRQVVIVEAAIADKKGTMKITSGLDSYNHLLLNDAGSVTGHEVAVTTLDEVVGARNVAGVKIDVQGAEELVLRGAACALRERRLQLIQLEWNHRSNELLGRPRTMVAELLRNYRYELFRANEGGRLVSAYGDESEGNRDMFAKPKG